MDVGTITISGLATKLDTQQIISQLGKIRQRPIQQLTQRQTDLTERLTVFQQLTAKVLALNTSLGRLTDGSAFRAVTVSSASSSDVMASGSSGAAVGEYQVQVTRLASNHKVSSASFAAADQALGLSGQFLLRGRVITVTAQDTLRDIRDAINGAGAGVSASILTVAPDDHRLVLSSSVSGAAGALDPIDANGANLLESLGIVTADTTIKHSIAQGAASDTFADKLSPVASVLGLTDPLSGTVKVNGVEVSIDLATDSLSDLAAALDAVEGVTASVVSTANGYRLELVGAEETPTLTDDGNVLVTLGVLSKSVAHEMAAAQDALLSIDGVSMSRSSNAVDDAIEGVQLQLLRPTEGAVRVSVAWDLEAAVKAVQDFVNSYNSVISLINDQQRFDPETNTGGAFLGNLTVMNLASSLRQQVSGLVNALGGSLQLASQVGINAGQKDELSLDSARLRAALQSDPTGVERLFGVAHQATSSQVQVVATTSATQDSGPDGWEVTITRAPARATALSAPLSEGIVVDETLTIGGKSVTLRAGMSLAEAADLLNAFFTAQKMPLQASVVGDRLQVQHNLWGASYGLVITSSLDDGAGGTDLGGALAGQAQNYVGEDVAGTIGGMNCTGSGRVLTGAMGTAVAGLSLLVSAEEPGDFGVVRVSKGIAARLTDYIAAATDPQGGTLTRAAEGAAAEIDAVQDRITALNEQLDSYIQKLQVDFARMEGQVSRSQTLLDWMTLQIDSLSSLNRTARSR